MAPYRENNPRLENALVKLKTLAETQTSTSLQDVEVDPSKTCLVDEALAEALPDCLVGESQLGRYLNGALSYWVDLARGSVFGASVPILYVLNAAEKTASLPEIQESALEALLRLEKCPGFQSIKNRRLFERYQPLVEQLQAMPEQTD